jgi:hypothetical protein
MRFIVIKYVKYFHRKINIKSEGRIQQRILSSYCFAGHWFNSCEKEMQRTSEVNVVLFIQIFQD